MAFKTLYDLVRNSIDRFSEKVAFTMLDGEEVTFKEVGTRIEKIQQTLTSAGLMPGDKVADAQFFYAKLRIAALAYRVVASTFFA